MALFCAAIRKDSDSLLMFSFLSHVHVFPCVISLVCRLKYPCSCSSSHFCFLSVIDHCIVSAVTGRCNQSFLALFYVVFDSLYRYIVAIFNAGESTSSFFS